MSGGLIKNAKKESWLYIVGGNPCKPPCRIMVNDLLQVESGWYVVTKISKIGIFDARAVRSDQEYGFLTGYANNENIYIKAALFREEKPQDHE